MACVGAAASAWVGTSVSVGVEVGVGVAVAVGVSVGSGVSVAVAVAVGVDVSVGVGDGVAVSVGVGVCVGVGVGVASAAATSSGGMPNGGEKVTPSSSLRRIQSLAVRRVDCARRLRHVRHRIRHAAVRRAVHKRLLPLVAVAVPDAVLRRGHDPLARVHNVIHDGRREIGHLRERAAVFAAIEALSRAYVQTRRPWTAG